MSDLQRDKLLSLVGDVILLDALKKVFENVIEKHRPTITNEDNKLLGEQYRGYEQSKAILEKAFTELETYATPRQPSSPPNRAI